MLDKVRLNFQSFFIPELSGIALFIFYVSVFNFCNLTNRRMTNTEDSPGYYIMDETGPQSSSSNKKGFFKKKSSSSTCAVSCLLSPSIYTEENNDSIFLLKKSEYGRH